MTHSDAYREAVAALRKLTPRELEVLKLYDLRRLQQQAATRTPRAGDDAAKPPGNEE